MNSELSTKVLSRTSAPANRPSVVVLGLESVGKSSLLSALTGRFAETSAFLGTTLHCERYSDDSWVWIDTPGLETDSDAATLRDTLSALGTAESVLIVLRAYRAIEELADLLPLLARIDHKPSTQRRNITEPQRHGKPQRLKQCEYKASPAMASRVADFQQSCDVASEECDPSGQGSRKVAIALTFRDRLANTDSETERKLLATWTKKLGVPVTLLDSRNPDAMQLADVRTAVMQARALLPCVLDDLPAFSEEQRRPWSLQLEQVLGFAPLSLLLLFGPAWVAVTQANALADRFYNAVVALLEPTLGWLNSLPAPLMSILGGDYGVVAMFPFLLLYALPTILIFTGLIAVYKSTGLIDRLSYGLHPWLKPFGLGGRDLVRVVMGFGCNVPAVVATRSCSSCSRGACVSAISFGSACSYQLPATLAVFAAAGVVWLGSVYLAVLAFTTLLYLRLTTPSVLRQAQNKMLLPALGHLRLPDWKAVLREILQSLRDFATMALPVFVGICIVAGLLEWSGVLTSFTRLLAPVMAAFHLPPEAALAVVLGSVRKDGLAIGLLNGDWDTLKVPMDSPIQILTAVYLAGVLLPCLVTVFTVAKEMRPGFALKMVVRQACFAALFSLCIAWSGALLFSINLGNN